MSSSPKVDPGPPDGEAQANEERADAARVLVPELELLGAPEKPTVSCWISCFISAYAPSPITARRPKLAWRYVCGYGGAREGFAETTDRRSERRSRGRRTRIHAAGIQYPALRTLQSSNSQEPLLAGDFHDAS